MASCDANAPCDFLYRETGVDWLAQSGYYLLVKPLRIGLIIVAALILRYAAHRMIKRIIRSAGASTRVGLFRPLRDRMPESLQEATGVRSQRRRQRAEALGSVLRSLVSVSIFSVAVIHPQR